MFRKLISRAPAIGLISYKHLYSFHYINNQRKRMQQPIWKQPEIKEDSYITGLRVRNSLCPDELVQFVPINGRRVEWYSCGPTVYTDSHIGHARCYIVNDSLRRIMRDYLNYDVFFVMNITDIDDKIIKAANDQGIDFLVHKTKCEESFFKDMDALNVEMPDQITRVTEFVDNIINFIKKIIENGFAYESNGSIYFDVEKFKESGHTYAKLEPSSANSQNKIGEVNINEDKKNSSDFALWKTAKPGEPSWDSPWGKGRPGWHIECSAMCDHAFGSKPTLDMHSGGSDLKFPHHDNEIAQSEAHNQCDQWINYFVHNGTMLIKGGKMSRSEKNYIRIKDILNDFTGRAVRMLCLTHQYDSVLNYNPETCWAEPMELDRQFAEFFISSKAVMRKGCNLENIQKYNDQDIEFSAFLSTKKASIHKHFLNNFNTPDVLSDLSQLVSKANTYMRGTDIKTTMLHSYIDYIGRILSVMGFDYTSTDGEQVDKEAAISSIVDVLTKFRDSVLAQVNENNIKGVFNECYHLRDGVLPHHGIRVEDRGNEPSFWKYQNPEELLEALRKKKEEQEEIARKKQEEKLRKEEETLRDPSTIFSDVKYAKFNIAKVDEKGIPTENDKGPFPAKIRGKFEKDYEKHVKARDALLEKKAKESEAQ